MWTHQAIADRLPDLHRHVEVRDLLVSGAGTILSLEPGTELAFVLLDEESPCVFIVGEISAAALSTAVAAIRAGSTQVVAPPACTPRLIEALAGWSHAPLIVHALNDPSRLPTAGADDVDWVRPTDLRVQGLPADLLAELESGGAHSPIAAARVDGKAVAFCYAGSQTETLWDVAVDTLEPFRRRGYAGRCVAHVARHMAAIGKQPVWQALHNNPASWRLAAKIGFEPIDELTMFEPPASSDRAR